MNEGARTEGELRKTIHLLRAALDGNSDTVFVKDRAGKYLFMNEAGARRFGRSASEIVGAEASKLFDAQSARHVTELDRRVMETGEPSITERTLSTPGGPLHIFAASRTPLRDENGKIVGVIGISRDVSKEKQNEAALKESEERYRAFVDHATDALFLHDEKCNIADVNRQACLSLGYSREDLIGMAPAEFDPDVTPKRVRTIMDELAAGRLVSFDSRHRRKDGSTFPVEIRLRPFSMNGKRYAIALVRDITSRKQAETALKESEARMKAAQRFAGLGVWQWDLGEKVWWSEELYNIYGRDPASFTPSYENFLSHIPADEHEKIIAALQKSMWSGSPYEHEYHIVRADGQLRTVRTEGVVDLDESGKPARMWGICRDITESKLAEEAIRRSEEIVNQHRMEVAHLSRVASLGEMASSLAHELNQPLTAILGYAGVCMDAARAHNGMASAKQMAEHLEELCKEARRAAEIIQRLRAHIRKQALHRSLQDVRAHMQEAVDLMRFELRRAGVKPEFQFSRNLSRVRVDSVQIQQVMINLIQNALDAMEDLKAADRKLVLKAAKADKGSVRVSVVDAGTGVPKEMSGRIFESFFTTKQDGLGLGLPICRSIIESHGGRLSATPNADRGMTFEFVLPAAGRT